MLPPNSGSRVTLKETLPSDLPAMFAGDEWTLGITSLYPDKPSSTPRKGRGKVMVHLLVHNDSVVTGGTCTLFVCIFPSRNYMSWRSSG